MNKKKYSSFFLKTALKVANLQAPSSLARDPQLDCDVVSKVELLLPGQVVGALEVLDRVV